jgi:ribosomal protein S18 acetylase RimI-like enzyme
MAESSKQGVVERRSLTAAEFADVEALADACARYDDVDLRLSWSTLRSRVSEVPEAFLYYRNGALAGFLALDGVGSEEAEGSGMVHPEQRRTGVFSALVAAARAACRQNGTPCLVLVCDQRADSARAFLLALGAEYDMSEQKMRLATPGTTAAPEQTLDFQKAAIEDAEMIAQIISDDSGMDATFFRQMVVGGIQSGLRQFYVAKVNGETIGTINVDMIDGDPYIYGFVIRPEYRRYGYGRQMLARTIEELIAARPQPVYLEVEIDNIPALALYRSFGFVVAHVYEYYRLDV